jgi:Predicted metal-dependent hydrolase
MKQLIMNGIEIELERKRIKNMYLRILPPDGRIHISAPSRMKEDEIKGFVLSKLDWIEKQQQKMRLSITVNTLEYVTGEEIMLWGKKRCLKVSEGYSDNRITLDGDILVLSVKGDSMPEKRRKIMNDWYRKQLQQEIPSLLLKWEKIIGVRASGFTIRDMKTRWGTCNLRSKSICLNLQLAKKAPRCLEYVVVHELVHLLERSHNYIFKSYMDHFLPDWRMIKKELNGNGF